MVKMTKMAKFNKINQKNFNSGFYKTKKNNKNI